MTEEFVFDKERDEMLLLELSLVFALLNPSAFKELAKLYYHLKRLHPEVLKQKVKGKIDIA